jgi:hypothetical protein
MSRKGEYELELAALVVPEEGPIEVDDALVISLPDDWAGFSQGVQKVANKSPVFFQRNNTMFLQHCRALEDKKQSLISGQTLHHVRDVDNLASKLNDVFPDEAKIAAEKNILLTLKDAKVSAKDVNFKVLCCVQSSSTKVDPLAAKFDSNRERHLAELDSLYKGAVSISKLGSCMKDWHIDMIGVLKQMDSAMEFEQCNGFQMLMLKLKSHCFGKVHEYIQGICPARRSRCQNLKNEAILSIVLCQHCFNGV